MAAREEGPLPRPLCKCAGALVCARGLQPRSPPAATLATSEAQRAHARCTACPREDRMEEGVQAPEAGSGHLDRTFWVPGAWKLAWRRDVGSVGTQPWPSHPWRRARLEEGWVGLGPLQHWALASTF